MAIEPPTPTHSQQEDGHAVRTCECAEEYSSRDVPSAGEAVCRADLSGAVLLILQQNAPASDAAGNSDSQRRKPHTGRLSEFVSGNYKDYYKFRLPTEGRDPRLQVRCQPTIL